MMLKGCGGYKVSVARGRVIVRCRVCGTSTFSRTGARRLAAILRGPLGRFETRAPRGERLRLATLLTAVAS